MKNKNMILLGLMIIMIMSLSSMVQATPSASYKVKAGDKQSYKIDKLNLDGNTSLSTNFTLSDGTNESVTITQGSVLTMEICNVTGTGSTAEVFAKTTFNGKTSACQLSTASSENPSDVTNLDVISPIYDNSSVYQSLVNQDNKSYSLSGNEFTTTLNDTIIGYTLFISQTTNIHTGWANKLNLELIAPNGTVLEQLAISQTSSGLPGFEITSTMLLFIVVAPVILLYRKKKLS